LFKGYGAKVGLGNMRVKAENRMVTSSGFPPLLLHHFFQCLPLMIFYLFSVFVISF
jgi:hypothetical protein